MDKDIISQEEIDLLLSMEETDDNPGNQADEVLIPKDRETVGSVLEKDPPGTGDNISQDEIDTLSGETAGKQTVNLTDVGKDFGSPSSGDNISQDEIDTLLGETAGKQTVNLNNAVKESNSPSSADTISQDEIDSMLEGTLVDDEPGKTESGGDSSGSDSAGSTVSPVPEKPPTVDMDTLIVPEKTKEKYKLYDFRRPDKLSRDQVRRMKVCFESAPRYLMNYFAKLLRSRIEVNLVEIDQRNYGDIFEGESNLTVIGVFNLGSGKTDGIIEISTHLFYCIVERLMGGTGTSITPIRPVTDFERYLATDIYNSILQFYKDILAKIVKIEPVVDVIESDSQFIPKTLSEDEILVRNTYEIKIDGISGYLNISIPYVFIGPYFARFSNLVKKKEKKKPDISSAFVRKGMGHIKIPVYAEFNKKNISAGEAMRLCKGSIITLEHPRNMHLKVNINGRPKFMGVPGLKGNKLSIKITQIVEDDEEICQSF
ncbi:MAG: FliM/FliN family flagellar motor switch protein [Candidatus Eremiobacteraeota bacterium]|nr:FliM/FliN family flagellar motor switch protein [Candidatus Eremiobacteraeota bacterium]